MPTLVVKAPNERTQLFAFVIYTILFESLIWGIFGWAVFVKGHSGWWFIFAAYLSSAQLRRGKFLFAAVAGKPQ